MDPMRTFCDEFYVTSRLYLRLDLEPSRETILHFFERVRREFPLMSKMRRQDDGAVVLEDADTGGDSRRYVRLDSDGLRFGTHNPEDLDEIAALADCVLAQAPSHLTITDLDVDHLEIVFGFDLDYRGNHDELVAEALFSENPVFSNLAGSELQVVDCQPFWGVSLTPDCETQAYVEVKSRTSTFEVRTGEYERAPLTVYTTARRYWGLGPRAGLVDIHGELLSACGQFAAERVIPHIVQPLAQAIASRR